jgi:hypothetical protein
MQSQDCFCEDFIIVGRNKQSAAGTFNHFSYRSVDGQDSRPAGCHVVEDFVRIRHVKHGYVSQRRYAYVGGGQQFGHSPFRLRRDEPHVRELEPFGFLLEVRGFLAVANDDED